MMIAGGEPKKARGEAGGEDKPQAERGLSLDTILFVVLWSAQFWMSAMAGMVAPLRGNNLSLVVWPTRVLNYDPLAGLLLAVLGIYLGAALFLKGRVQHGLKLAALWGAIIAFVIFPTAAAINERGASVPYLYIHDGALQIEEAGQLMLSGKNPYAEDYVSTALAKWPFYYPGVATNPALYHFIYLPLLPLVSGPVSSFAQAVIGWYDERLIYLAMFLACILLLLRMGRTPDDRLAGVALFALNPLFTPFFAEGRNDIVISFFLLPAILLFQRGRIGWGSIWIGLAAATKQTSWFLIPFLLLYLFGRRPRSEWAAAARRLLPGAALTALIVVPFLLWNPGAFIDDTIKYQGGALTDGTNYPIKSLGLGSLALGFGWVQSGLEAFPFSAIQLAATAGGLALLLVKQRRNNTLRQALGGFAVLLLISGFFARTFNDNHLGFALTWLVLPGLILTEEGSDG